MSQSSSLAIERACAADPVNFARYRLRNTEGDPIVPDDWQARILRTRERQIIANCCRRAGKSAVAAVLAAWTAVYSPGSTTLIVSRGQDQAKELFQAVSGFLKSHPSNPRMSADSMTRCSLTNGSRVISLATGDSVRGYSPQLIIVDEAAFVDDRTHKAIRPMLALKSKRANRAARLVMMSTPHGRRGEFFETWTNGGPEWHREKITANDCPRIDQVFMEQERQRIGEFWLKQEYYGEFCEAEDQLFSNEHIDAAFCASIKPLSLRVIT
jgi:hypothetical protein